MNLTPREKKFIRAALAAGLLFALAEFLWEVPQERQLDVKEELLLARKQFRHSRELLAAASQLQDQVANVQARLRVAETRLLAGPQVPKAGAEFLGWLTQQAGQYELEIFRSDFLAPGSLAGFTTVPVRLELNGRITQLVAFVSDVLAADRLLGIQDLEIAQRGLGQEKQVRCVLVVVGLMKKTSEGD